QTAIDRRGQRAEIAFGLDDRRFGARAVALAALRRLRDCFEVVLERARVGRRYEPLARARAGDEQRRARAQQRGDERAQELAHCPYSSRSASESGRRAARIAAAAPATSYSVGRYEALSSSRSSSTHAARGSPSRGWPTVPGFISHSPPDRSSCGASRRASAG